MKPHCTSFKLSRGMPERDDELEDLVWQRRPCRAGLRAPRPGPRCPHQGSDWRGAEEAQEVRRRRRATGESEVAEREEFDTGLSLEALPGPGLSHGPNQIEDLFARRTRVFIVLNRRHRQCINRYIIMTVTKTVIGPVSQQQAHQLTAAI